METVIINRKEYKVADAVAKEIEWLNIQVNLAKEIGRQIEDLDDEFETQRYKYLGDRQKLLNEIREL